jgi:hypothetical protein
MQQTTTPHPLDDEAGSIESRGPLPIQQRATVEIVMTENPKTPAKKTIEDPPEYVAATGKAAPSSSNIKGGYGAEREATYQQNGQSEVNDRGRVPADDVAEKKAPKGSLSGETAGRMGTGNIGGEPQDVAEVPNEKESGPTDSGKAQGEGARNPQTGERIARNPRTGS